MKCLINNSNKAEKLMVVIETAIKLKSELTGNGSWPVSTETKLQIDWNNFENGKAQKSKYFFWN